MTLTCFKQAGLQVPNIQGASLVSAIRVKANAYPDDPTYELSLLAECMNAIHCGSHVDCRGFE
jgi:hypothetical protein